MSNTIPCGKHTVVHGKLTGSEFRDVCLGEAVFDDVNLGNARFHNINLSGAKFDDVNLSGVEITHADYTGMKIDGVLVTDLLEAYRQKTGQVKV